MNKNGPIIIIDDDIDDQEVFTETFRELPFVNDIINFSDGEKALAYLDDQEVKPFLIISDLNMYKLNGSELRRKLHLHDKLSVKCTPCIYFTTTPSNRSLLEAYSTSIQGFFVKPYDIVSFKNLLKHIVTYWQFCAAPQFS